MRKVDPKLLDMNRKKIGGKWKPVILFVLRSKPARFNKLKQLIIGISGNMLTSALRELERDRLVINEDGNYMLTENAEKIVDLMLQIKCIVDIL